MIWTSGLQCQSPAPCTPTTQHPPWHMTSLRFSTSYTWKKKKVLPGNIIQAAVRFSCLNVIGKKQMSSIYTSFLGDRLGPTASSYCRWVLCPVYVRHLCVFVLRKPWNSNQAVKKPGNIGVLFACPYWNASPTSESVSQSLQHSGCSAKHYSISQTFT